MSWIVKHKNVKVLVGNKNEWAVDGYGLNWNKAQAEAHALLCEFKAHNIPYEVVEVKEVVEDTVKETKKKDLL